VPIEKIVSRYVRSMANLSAAISLADRVYAYDNSVDDVEARLCARTEDGAVRKIYGELPDWVTGSSDNMIVQLVQSNQVSNSVWMQLPGGAVSVSVSGAALPERV
jgi:predicted ABC-type ATPase